MDIEINEVIKKSPKKMISLQVPETMYESLKKEAEARMMSVSDVVRLVVYEKLMTSNVD